MINILLSVRRPFSGKILSGEKGWELRKNAPRIPRGEHVTLWTYESGKDGERALIFMRSDTRWFQRCVLSRARYLFLWKGRIRFCRPDGETHGNQPNAPSCLVAWDNTEAPLLHTLQNRGYGKVAVL